MDNLELKDLKTWEIPRFKKIFWMGKSSNYCVVIPVINEGERIHALLTRMNYLQLHQIADVIIIDGGSVDNSLNVDVLKKMNVRCLLIKNDTGGLSSQLRCAYAFALQKGYKGIITIDGNNKDDPDQIPQFIDKLESGIDFVQASRFIKGGKSVNTPKLRYLAIRYIHAPILSFFSGFNWTDSTQGFRGYRRELLLDSEISIFRKIFFDYELLPYISYRAPKIGYRCMELPSTRTYPKGIIPTKISAIRGNFLVLSALLMSCFGFYNKK